MRNTTAIMQRELLSLFFSPIGYIVIAGFRTLRGNVNHSHGVRGEICRHPSLGCDRVGVMVVRLG